MKKLLLSLAALTVLFASCEKDGPDDGAEATNLTNTEMIINEDATIEDALETSDYEVDFFTGSDENLAITLEDEGMPALKSPRHDRRRLRYLYGQAPNVTIDTAATGYPITIVLDYGDGTELLNGKVLKGKIIITITAPPRTDGAERQAKFEGFFVDSVGIEGFSSHLIDMGADSSTVAFVYNRELVFNFWDQTTITREENRRREWVSGILTPWDLSDDEIQITGYATSTSRDGIVYQRKITETLIKIGTCRSIVQGMVEFSIDGEVKMTLDYGDGNCDNLATVTRNGEQKTVRIGKLWKRVHDHRNKQ
jgi:hypothetical protein